jgi:stage IV sporulation protein FB
MAYQDRPYYRDSSGSTGNPLNWLVSGSVLLFTAFGIRVRLHASLLIVMILILLFGIGGFGNTASLRVQSVTMLFMVILLHEFGHCFAARSVGGDANEIVMTPLGGLAMAMAPRRPWATFVTVAGGPLVNIIICSLCAAGLYFILGVYPLGPWTFGKIYPAVRDPGWWQLSSYLFWIYATSWFLLAFNMLPIFPMDGGQMLQSILWRPMGYYKSMMLTVNIGMVGSALLFMVGLATLGTIGGGVLLMIIAANCFINCYQQRLLLKAEGPWGFTEEQDSTDYSAAYEPATPRKRRLRRWAARRAQRRALKEAREQRLEQQRIDAILAKVSAHGMHSLNWLERRALKKATEHQRKAEKRHF